MLPICEREASLTVGEVTLAANLILPQAPKGLVIFAHGSGSSRHSPRNREVASALGQAGMGTLLFDLLTEEEGRDRALVFDIGLLAARLQGATMWASSEPDTGQLPVGYFGASTGAAAALLAAADLGQAVKAVVSRGGRPDLAANSLPRVSAPTLLLVGELDPEVLQLNHHAARLLRSPHRLVVVGGATHLFTEPGRLTVVARLATDWFADHIRN